MSKANLYWPSPRPPARKEGDVAQPKEAAQPKSARDPVQSTADDVQPNAGELPFAERWPDRPTRSKRSPD
jgi:hypothetical protein